MGLNVLSRELNRLDSTVESILETARIPGAAMAVVMGCEMVLARGYGHRDAQQVLPMTPDTLYPIASTTKAMTATLLGMLVEEGAIFWDAPIRDYLPRFRLHNSPTSGEATIRDLLTMRTGLPRHDFVWTDDPISRVELVERVAHLPLSAGLRERFQYNNLGYALAGHIAEIVAGTSWEHLISRRILSPLAMNRTCFASPEKDNVTVSWHETDARSLVLTRRWATEPIGPAGGSIHSTVEEMARWVALNLNGGELAGQRLLQPATLNDIHTPQVFMGADPTAPSPNAAYALGWFVDTYNGRKRISHTGWLHDVNGCITLFPDDGVGIVSFINFASSRLSPVLNEHVFDCMTGLSPVQSIDGVLARYEENIEHTRRRNSNVARVERTSPSHVLDDYAGTYVHAGYGRVVIRRDGPALIFVRNGLELALQHWHYDAWVVADNDLFEIHKPHPFERSNRILFETGPDGVVAAFSMQMEPAVRAARFVRDRLT